MAGISGVQHRAPIFAPGRAADVSRALWLTYITLVWMTIEGAASLLLGWSSKSLLLEAFGIDSVVELFSAGVLLWRLKVEASGLADETRVEMVERKAARWVGYSLYALVAYVLFNSAYGLFVVERVTDTHESAWGILILSDTALLICLTSPGSLHPRSGYGR